MDEQPLDDDEATFFQINAAASFAAVVAPEDQLAELALQQLDLDRACEAIDALTPLELAQVALMMQHFAAPRAAADAPTAQAATTPLFRVGNAAPLTQRWVRQQEKQLMQGLQALGLALNREAASSSSSDAAAAASASSSSSRSAGADLPVFSLLFKGAKLTSPATLSALLADVHALLALEDVVQPNLLVKQVLSEVTRSASAILTGGEGEEQEEEEEKKSADEQQKSAAATDAPPSRSAVLRTQLARAHVVPCSSTGMALGAPFSFDLASGALRCPSFDAVAFSDPAQEQSLRRTLGLLREVDSSPPASDAAQHGELLAALLPYIVTEVCRAVWSAVLSASPAPSSVASASSSSAAKAHARALLSLCGSLSSSSPLAALLSAEDAAVQEQPGDFFTALIGATLERRAQAVQQQRAVEAGQGAAAASALSPATASQTEELVELVSALRQLAPVADDVEAHQDELRRLAGTAQR